VYERSLGAVPRHSLSQLIDAITSDAYGTDEAHTGFLTAFEEHLAVPCVTQVLDVEVEVLKFDLEGDERRGLVARCRRMGGRPLADVCFVPGPVASWLRTASRRWLGFRAFPARRPPRWSWPEP
jgi:hypothetical protein